jgi:GNAT superfamily N-acetyltransferase
MTEILQETSPAKIVTALHHNWLDSIRTFRLAQEVEVYDRPELLWFMTGLPSGEFNAVMHTDLSERQVEQAIREVRSYFRSKRMPLSWLTGPLSRPGNLERWLENEGFRQIGQVPGMALDLWEKRENRPTRPAPANFTIEEVKDEETLQEWAETERRGFEVEEKIAPGLIKIRLGIGPDGGGILRHYLGRLNGRPVAIATLLFTAGVAGVYDVAIVPEARRQGLGTLITLTVLNEARQLGYRIAILQPSSIDSKRIYARLGFKQYCHYNVYL